MVRIGVAPSKYHSIYAIELRSIVKIDSGHLGPRRLCRSIEMAHGILFAYRDDKNLRFAPIRLASNPEGEPVLFSYWQPWDMSRMVGTLIYHAGQFSRDPRADTAAYI
jgi:hypothetical protein